MGNLAHLTNGQSRDASEGIQQALLALLASRVDENNSSKDVISELAKSKKLLVDLNDKLNNNDFAQKTIAELNKSLGVVERTTSAENRALMGEIKNLANALSRLPTQFPEQIKTDLSGLDKRIKAVGMAIKSIPTSKIPDLSSVIKELKKEIADINKMISKRVHVFEIHRDSQKLVNKITVSTK